ncbi:MAG: HlyD family efflux transporter periplasmic adaptor subunit [Phycisphaerales bacterium]|nr:MAG: HlyD family efflux transporter periplasmic adaptor subunit [Phycisphaerales bacterium]
MTPTHVRLRPHARADRARRGGTLLKLVVGLTILAGGTVGVLAATGNLPGLSGGEAREVADRARTANIARAEHRTFDITTIASGELQSRNQIELRAEVETGTSIVEIVPEGIIVEPGDVLVRLSSAALQDQIDEELLRVEAARNDLAAAQTALRIQQSDNASRLRNAELQVELAELALLQWQEGERVRREKELRVNLENRERDLERLRDKFEQSKSLLANDFLSLDEYKLDEIRLAEGEAAFSIAQLDLETYANYQRPRDQKQRQSDVANAKADLQKTIEENEINLADRQLNVTSRERQLALREQRLSKLREQYEACTVRAPSGGLVVYATSLDRNRRGGSEGPLQVGHQVRPNDLLIVLPDTSRMMAEVRVHESLAGRVRRGQPATIRVDAAGNETYNGRVESVGVLAETGGWRDPNRREYTVRVAIEGDNSEGILKPSMRAEAELQLGRVEDALSVPIQSVFSDGPVRYVYVPRGTRYARVPVAVGRRSNVFAEITGGLSDGDRVLITEPEPNNVLEERWTEEQLRVAGLATDERGQIVPIAFLERENQVGGGSAPPQGGTSRGTGARPPQAARSGAGAN